jgi:signal peptidase I
MGVFKKIRKKLASLKWLDPFTYVDIFFMPHVKKITQSKLVEDLVNLFFAAFFAVALYVILGFAFGTSAPLMIVYSGSMENTLFRGDIAMLRGANADSVFAQEISLDKSLSGVPVFDYASIHYDLEKKVIDYIEFFDGQKIFPNKTGSIVVYNAYPMNIPIIHRAVVKVRANDGVFVLTKGDNDSTNPTIDQDCGKIILNRSEKPCITFYAIDVKSLQGSDFFTIPKLGCVKLWVIDNPLSLITTGKMPSDFRGYC